MLFKLYLFTITQLFTEGVEASSDVKSILRNGEICGKLPGYCTSKTRALMDDMADLVEITEDIFFPGKLIHLSVFSKYRLGRVVPIKQIANNYLRKYVPMIDNVASDNKAQDIRIQFAEYIRDNMVNHYDDYDISFDKYESKIAKTQRRSEELVWNYVTHVMKALEYLKKDDPVVRKLTYLCPLRRKNRSFAAMTIDEPLSRSKRTQDTQLYPSFEVCTGNTNTIASECSDSNWMSMGISWRLTNLAPRIRKVVCNEVDNVFNNK